MTKNTSQYAVLWDLDGTLVDTGEPHYRTWRDTLAEIGVPFTREDFAAVFGMNNAGLLAVIFGEQLDHDLAISLVERKEALFREIIRQGLAPLPGIVDWLTCFQQWGVRQAIASSAPWDNIQVALDSANLRQYFDAEISGEELPPKPNPDVFLKAVAELGVSSENCVVVEDSVAGLGGALAAGMGCIAVTTTNPPEKLAEADLIFDSLAEMSEKAFLDLTGWEV